MPSQPPLSLTALKDIKNSVIGNPTAKASVACNLSLLVDILQCLISNAEDEVIEAAHVLKSISYGSRLSVRNLARQQAIPALLHALTTQTAKVQVVIARALHAIATALAECIGPGFWGIGYAQVEPLEAIQVEPVDDSIASVRTEVTEALNLLFSAESLDIWLPHLSRPQTAFHIASLIGSAVSAESHQLSLTSWLPPSLRSARPISPESPTALTKRGWEKPKPKARDAKGKGPADFENDGGWATKELCQLLTGDNKNSAAALGGLAALCNGNAGVAEALRRPSFYDYILAFANSGNASLSIPACLCLANIIRASSLRKVKDIEIYAPEIVNALHRLIGSNSEHEIQARACHILQNLLRDDKDLIAFCTAAGSISRLFSVLGALPVYNTNSDIDEPPVPALLREAALVALATLLLPREAISETRTMAMNDLSIHSQLTLHHIIFGALVHPAVGVRYGALMLTRALSRDVSMTHTILQGHDNQNNQNAIGEKVLEIVADKQEDRRVVGAALAAICNLVTNCSPLRDLYLRGGILSHLIYFLDLPTKFSSAAPHRLNTVWAIKNLLYKATLGQKMLVLKTFGSDRILSLLLDSDRDIVEQGLCLVRNFADDPKSIQAIVSARFPSTSYSQISQSLLYILRSLIDDSKSQVINVHVVKTLANIANGNSDVKKLIWAEPGLVHGMLRCINETNGLSATAEARKPAVAALHALVCGNLNHETAREVETVAPDVSYIPAGITTELRLDIISTLTAVCDWDRGGMSPSFDDHRNRSRSRMRSLSMGRFRHTRTDEEGIIVEFAREILDILTIRVDDNMVS